MRRSFGPNLGGGAGGGGMMRKVHRAMRAGIGDGPSQESYSHAAGTRSTGNRNQPITTTLSLSSNTNYLSSPCNYHFNQHVHEAPPYNWAAGEEFDWEYVDAGGNDDDGDSVNGFYDDLVFGSVPSEEEVHHAVSSLREVLEPVSFAQLMKNRETNDISDQRTGLESDWSEPSMQLYTVDKVFDAFGLLQSEPSVQRMVISLSSDNDVWNAVMNNEVVRELRESFREDKSISDASEVCDDDSKSATQVLRWIFVNAKDRMLELVEKITKVISELVRPMNNEKPKRDTNAGRDLFDEKLRSSFFISIVVLLIVVVSRYSK